MRRRALDLVCAILAFAACGGRTGLYDRGTNAGAGGNVPPRSLPGSGGAAGSVSSSGGLGTGGAQAAAGTVGMGGNGGGPGTGGAQATAGTVGMGGNAASGGCGGKAKVTQLAVGQLTRARSWLMVPSSAGDRTVVDRSATARQ